MLTKQVVLSNADKASYIVSLDSHEEKMKLEPKSGAFDQQRCLQNIKNVM